VLENKYEILTSMSSIHAAKLTWESIRGAVSIAIRHKPAMFLSGGLDTGLIAAACNELFYKPEAFTVTYPGYENDDEMKFARNVAKEFGFKHHVDVMTKDDCEDARKALDSLIGKPIPRASECVYFAYKKLAEHGVRDVMGGHGGDEIFGSYTWKYNVPRFNIRKKMETLWHINFYHLKYIETVIAERFGVRLHMPFVDPMVLAIGLRLPLELLYDPQADLMNAYGGKIIPRKIAKTKLPEGMAQAKKRGFTIPEAW
jgi:asparagine synthetase B (glutamine-hydrolysing)